MERQQTFGLWAAQSLKWPLENHPFMNWGNHKQLCSGHISHLKCPKNQWLKLSELLEFHVCMSYFLSQRKERPRLAQSKI